MCMLGDLVKGDGGAVAPRERSAALNEWPKNLMFYGEECFATKSFTIPAIASIAEKGPFILDKSADPK
jgi:hypothetical protein